MKPSWTAPGERTTREQSPRAERGSLSNRRFVRTSVWSFAAWRDFLNELKIRVGGASAGAVARRFETRLVRERGERSGLNHERVAVDARSIREEASLRRSGRARAVRVVSASVARAHKKLR